ncbi:MAG: hypothetical protein EA392_04625 [Cryomorphaceae bacterium]|nr:MAG: hypothetical protein EA392_04625 [Cryomorphaceae bacterium]
MGAELSDALALLRLPGRETEAFSGSASQNPGFPAISSDGFLYMPFGEDSEQAFFLEPDPDVENVRSQIAHFTKNLHADAIPDTDPVDYQIQAQTILGDLRHGGMKKVILSRVKQTPVPDGFNPLSLFDRLCQVYPNATIHLLIQKGQFAWLGATPELLLDFENRELKTVSLAGTRALLPDGTPSADWSNKELEEQQLVTEFIRDVLEQTPHLNLQKIEAAHSVRAGNVIHLCSRFFAQSEKGFSWTSLLKRLHPTPAIAGLPRDAALKLIEQTESHPRSYYGGFLGKAGPDSARLYLNLRCLRFTNTAIEYYAGGGYTAASDAEDEWNETEHKIRTLLSVVENLRNFEKT